MAIPQIESRVAALEAEVAQLKSQLGASSNRRGDWLDDFSGVFAGDRIYEEAMSLGREYRESLRPKASTQLRDKTAKGPVKGRARR